jgi:hypothetical protein
MNNEMVDMNNERVDMNNERVYDMNSWVYECWVGATMQGEGGTAMGTANTIDPSMDSSGTRAGKRFPHTAPVAVGNSEGGDVELAEVKRVFASQEHVVFSSSNCDSCGRCGTCEATPLLSEVECSRLIAAAEAEAKVRRQAQRCTEEWRKGPEKGGHDNDVLSGWTTRRHVNYPTTDIPINEIQGGVMLPWFREALRTRLLPWAAACFPALVEDAVEDTPNDVKTAQERIRRLEPEDLWVYDAFVARYDGSETLRGGRAALPLHRDKSLISFTVGLNAKSDFGGGGTFFSHLNRTINTDTGEAVVFAGGVEHAGAATTSGTRYVLVLFVHVKGHQSRAADSIHIPVVLRT